MVGPGDGGSETGQRLRAEADRIEDAAATAEEQLHRLAWHGPEAADARDRATVRRRRAGQIADGLRTIAAAFEAGEGAGHD